MKEADTWSGRKMNLPKDESLQTEKVRFTQEKETMLITLYARSLESRSKDPVLRDPAGGLEPSGDSRAQSEDHVRVQRRGIQPAG